MEEAEYIIAPSLALLLAYGIIIYTLPFRTPQTISVVDLKDGLEIDKLGSVYLPRV
ncbi:MAG: hypothetical protein LBJ20_00425 [Candidatus Methanoplasma sp.]|jgi:hypothetical protein|nr:hypothetical protein [Candidatus Methanoplasma sp.]